MDVKIITSGDIYEDNQSLKIMINAPDMHNAITVARQQIRARLKFNEKLRDEERSFLENLLEDLYVEGIEL